jgi:hypothetical protein
VFDAFCKAQIKESFSGKQQSREENITLENCKEVSKSGNVEILYV